MPPRRFPPPWTIDEMNDACFIVRNNNEQGLAQICFRVSVMTFSYRSGLTFHSRASFCASAI